MLTMFSVIHRLLICYCNKMANRYIRELAHQNDHFILVPMKGITRPLLAKEYFADRLHPNDKALNIWSGLVLKRFRASAVGQQLL